METELFSFEKLEVYQLSRRLIKDVYGVIDQLPQCEKFALGQQLQRSIVSVASNIAEGGGRISYDDKIRFIEFSYGSLLEAYCQMQLCNDLGYISEDRFKGFKPQFFAISKLLKGLKQSYWLKIQSK